MPIKLGLTARLFGGEKKKKKRKKALKLGIIGISRLPRGRTVTDH